MLYADTADSFQKSFCAFGNGTEPFLISFKCNFQRRSSWGRNGERVLSPTPFCRGGGGSGGPGGYFFSSNFLLRFWAIWKNDLFSKSQKVGGLKPGPLCPSLYAAPDFSHINSIPLQNTIEMKKKFISPIG